MAALSGEEFAMRVLVEAEPESVDEWAVRAASIVAAVSLHPETYDSDVIVESLQILAFKMPAELVAAATQHMINTAAAMLQN